MVRASAFLALLLFAACGGDDEAPPPAEAPAAGETAAVQPDPAAEAEAQAAQAAETELVRETFTYTGAGRDPFVSLVTSGAVKPEPSDLRVVGIAYDARYPQRSVATLRDQSDGARYTMQTGDQVGRVRVQTIREREVVLTIEEFGLERQIVLTLSRRRQEVNP